MVTDGQELPFGAWPGPDAPAEPPAKGGFSAGKAAAWIFLATSLLFLGLGAIITWRWVDGNFLHWGVVEGKEETVDGAVLLERVRAFELATVKHTYDTEARIEAQSILNAGPRRITLPGFIAGQTLDVEADVVITAGVDMASVQPEDMTITCQGKLCQVTIRVPAPEILSAEIVPNSLDMSTNEGLITRLGIGEKDLRDRAADQVVLTAKEQAIRQGILIDAARESERRLQAFLQSIPQGSDLKITYVVITKDPPTQ